MSGSAVAGVSHDQSGRLPAISLRRQSVPGLPAAAAMHAQPEYGEGRDPTRVAGSERPGGCSSSGAARQEDLRTQERNGGTQLRRCQTAARASLRTHARLEERAPAVPAGSNGAEHQKNRPPAEPSGTESATGATPISAAPASGLRNPVAGTQQPLIARSLDHCKKTNPTKNQVGFVSNLTASLGDAVFVFSSPSCALLKGGSMKAVVFHDIGDIRLDDVQEPAIRDPYDAIVQLTASAICGTDLHMVRGTMPGMVPGTILGHEGVGVVEEIGTGVRNLSPGDRV